GQNIGFTASFINKSSTNLIVNPDSSFLGFSDGTNNYLAKVNGNFTITGTDSIPDTTAIAFKLKAIDPNFIPGLYDVRFNIFGNLPNGDTLTALDTVALNQLTVLREALVQVDSINIVADSIAAGQNNVEIEYYLTNSGSSPAIVDSANSIFQDSTNTDISNVWTLVFQSQSLPFQIDEGTSIALVRRFNVSDSIQTGRVSARLSGKYNDIRKPVDIKPFDNPAIYDSVNVIQPSVLRVDSLQLVNVPNAGHGTVNVGQAFDLRLILQNSGQEAIRDMAIELRKNNITVRTDTFAGPVAPGAPFESIYQSLTSSAAGNLQYQAIILEAFSVVSGQPVPVGQPVDNIEDVLVQEPAALTLLASVADSSLSQGQLFRVEFNISRAGASSFDSGKVKINLPTNYILAPGTPDSTFDINMNTLSGSWDVIAQGVTSGPDDTIRVDYLNVPQDSNTAQPVQLTNSAVEIPVRTSNFGEVSVSSISLEFPPGALDDTLSTSQTFKLKANFEFIGPVSSSGRIAELRLPPNEGFFADSTVQLLGNADSAVWQIRAPDTLVSNLTKSISGGRNGEKNFSDQTNIPNDPLDVLLGKASDIEVVLRAFEENTGVLITDSLNHTVVVEEKALLEAHATIVSPQGALDGILSTEQNFNVQVWVENSGEAQTTGNNRIFLRVPAGFAIEGTTADSIEINIPTGQSSAATVRLFAPVSPTPSQKNILVQIFRAANDENSNQPAAISQQQAIVAVNVVKRATLRVDSLKANPNVLTQNQPFTVTGKISNAGDAAIVPGDSVWVQIEFDPGNFSLAQGEIARKGAKLVNKTASVSWQVLSTQTANLGVHTISAFIDSTVSGDENTDSLAFIEKIREQTNVDIVDLGGIAIESFLFLNNMNDSLTVSSDQSGIGIHMKAQINPAYIQNNATATLVLPDGSGFTTDSSLIKRVRPDSTVSWNLTAPTQSLDWQKIQVILEAVSPINPQIVLTETDSAYIKVVLKANLLISGSIVAPAGATDDTVSYGQTFTYQAVVNNIGDAGLLNPPEGPQGTIEINPGKLLAISNGSPAEQPFVSGQPVQWEIVVDSSAAAADLIKQIKKIQLQKRQIMEATSQFPDESRRSGEPGNTSLISGKAEATVFQSLDISASDEQMSLLYSQLYALIDSSDVRVRIKTI
ncbi:MAG: hypothetical protein ACE5GL_02930, partial [Calditrichia bacterium]